MNKTLLLTILTALTMNAQAATKKITTSYSSNTTSNGLKFETRPGAGVTAGYFTFGMNLEGKYGFNIGGNSLFVGLETGFFRTSLFSNNFSSAAINGIPITPSANFEFPINNKFKLYAGTSLGIMIATASESINNSFGFETNSASVTNTVFMWKLRPGMVLNDMFIAELPIGTADGNFYFMPNVGVRF